MELYAPATLAKIVWSRPMPTCRPGWNFAALAHDDVAGDNSLAAELLHGRGGGRPNRARCARTACFLMRHRKCSLDYFVIASMRSTVIAWRWPFLRR